MCVLVHKGAREVEAGSKHTHTQIDRQTHTHTHTDTQTFRHTDTHTHTALTMTIFWLSKRMSETERRTSCMW